tara:strand:+ start:1499 stop:2797 length:1299 start_codon:yes stop_codon:yes gene_type:complete
MWKISIILLCLLTNITFGNGSIYSWGENPTESKGRWMFLQSSVEEKKYDEAIKPLHWLLKNTPDLNVALYIQSVKILEQNVKIEKNPERKKVLQDSVLWAYDERIKRFGDEAFVLNRKGRIALKYLMKRKNKEDELYSLYSRIYELNKDDMLVQNATNYFVSSVSVFKMNKIDKETTISIYSSLLSFLDKKEISFSSNDKKLSIVRKNRLKMSKYFDKHIPISCKEIQTYFGEDYQTSPTLDKAKSINTLLVKKKCLDSELFIQTNNKILETEPSSKRYSVAAKLYLNSGKIKESYNYFSKAVELENNDSIKSLLQLELAKISLTIKDYSKAKSEVLSAINLNSNNKKAYEFLGDLYLVGATSCISSDVLVKKSIYIIAYKQYLKSGNVTKMESTKKQFPTIEEIFVRNKKEGDIIKVGCWINENVPLQKNK